MRLTPKWCVAIGLGRVRNLLPGRAKNAEQLAAKCLWPGIFCRWWAGACGAYMWGLLRAIGRHAFKLIGREHALGTDIIHIDGVYARRGLTP